MFFGCVTFAQQNLTREQKLQKIDELNAQIKTLETDVILPDAKDFKQAQKENVDVFRLMPREKYDGKLTIRGGGAFYSFYRKSSEYGQGSDIGLEQNFLSLIFAGADYGFIYDLSDVPLADVSKDTAEAGFLLEYKPPTRESEVRIEQRKAADYEGGSVRYKSRISAVVGHAYLLRSIIFDRSDIFVAFKIVREDADGSLIIFWKTLETFKKQKFQIPKKTTPALI